MYLQIISKYPHVLNYHRLGLQHIFWEAQFNPQYLPSTLLFLHWHLGLWQEEHSRKVAQKPCRILRPGRTQSAWWQLRTCKCRLQAGSLLRAPVGEAVGSGPLGDHRGPRRGTMGCPLFWRSWRQCLGLTKFCWPSDPPHPCQGTFPEVQSPTVSHSRSPTRESDAPTPVAFSSFLLAASDVVGGGGQQL